MARAEALSESARVEERRAFQPLQELDVSSAGVPLPVHWAGVAGATAVEVSSASLTLAAAVRTENLGDVDFSTEGNQRVVRIPSGKRLRSLTLKGLRLDDGSEAISSSALAGRRLAIIVQTSGALPAPQYAVPPIGRRNLLPEQLTGARYENKVLSLPDVAGTRVRVVLVQGDAPEDFSERAWQLDQVSAVAAVLPRDLSLLEPDGQTLAWAFPGEMPAQSPLQNVELRPNLQKLLGAALAENQPLSAALTLKTSNTAKLRLHFAGARGALLRSFPGVIATELAGDPVAIALPGVALANERPATVTADLTVHYLGVRLLPELCDALPSAQDTIEGFVVSDSSVVRAFPPEAFNSVAPARIGLYGRAPEACELSLQWVQWTAGLAGKACAPPSVIRLEPSRELGTHWFELPEATASQAATGVSVRATRGRFFWAAREARPLLRVAVRDPAPGGRALLLNGASISALHETKLHQAARSLPANAFVGGAPALSSELFLRVELSDLSLRYAR